MNEAFLQDSASGTWFCFRNPLRNIEVYRWQEVLPALREIEQLVEEQAWYAVGFVTYDAAPGFDSALSVHEEATGPTVPLPLLSFAFYAAPEVRTTAQLFSVYRNRQDVLMHAPDSWSPSVDRPTYVQAIDTIRDQIRRGNTYQVNYTWRIRKPFTGDPFRWFGDLVGMQRARHAAYLDTGRFAILSASPELFFSLHQRRLMTKPMKGTAARAPSPAADQQRAMQLRASIKDRAENVMIVDMMRNDVGRIAAPGSVQVPHLFEIEQYPTVWQMTSTVEAVTDCAVSEIFRALFPAASVTGAPKTHTMKLIASLETTPRGLYTGAIGFIAPERRAAFNVAIRTVVLDRMTGVAEYGVGGGIVWDSEAGAEYAECLAKAQVLWNCRPRFALLETLRWTPAERFFLFAEHIERLSESARYFGYLFDPEGVRGALTEAAAHFPPSPHRVRLLLHEEGRIHIESAPLDDLPTEVFLAIATTAIDSSDPFFYHKTTHRVGYERVRCASPMWDDVLLWNERAEVTETTRANLVIELDGARITPPVTAGLLAGTYRRTLLEQGLIQEGTVTLADLSRASALWVINSVRGWRRATLLTDTQ